MAERDTSVPRTNGMSPAVRAKPNSEDANVSLTTTRAPRVGRGPGRVLDESRTSPDLSRWRRPGYGRDTGGQVPHAACCPAPIGFIDPRLQIFSRKPCVAV